MPYSPKRMCWVCPECEREFGNTGKGKEKYIIHLEGHL